MEEVKTRLEIFIQNWAESVKRCAKRGHPNAVGVPTSPRNIYTQRELVYCPDCGIIVGERTMPIHYLSHEMPIGLAA